MKKILIYGLITLLLVPLTSKAADVRDDTYTLLQSLPSVESGGVIITEMPLEDYIGYIFKFAIALAAFLAVIMIILGGFEYMTTESFSGKGNAKKRIQNALTGLLMVLASYLILRTIDPRLVDINTKIPELAIDTKDVTTYLNELSRDLSLLGTEERQRVLVLDSRIKVNEAEAVILEAKKKNQTIANEETVRLERVNQEIYTDKTARGAVILRGVADHRYAEVVGVLTNPGSYLRNQAGFLAIDGSVRTTPETDDIIKNSKERLSNGYQREIESLNPNTDAIMIRELNKERNFYLTSINNQQKLMTDLIDYKTTPTSSELAAINNQKNQYQTHLDALNNQTISENNTNQNLIRITRLEYQRSIQAINSMLATVPPNP